MQKPISHRLTLIIFALLFLLVLPSKGLSQNGSGTKDAFLDQLDETRAQNEKAAPAQIAARRSWLDFNQSLASYFSEYSAATRGSNPFFQKNRLEKIQSLLKDHGIKAAPILYDGFLRLAQEQNEPALGAVAEPFAPSEAQKQLRSCGKSKGFSALLACFAGVIHQAIDSPHQLWLPSQASLVVFQAFFIMLFLLFLAFYLKDLSFIHLRWKLIFPGISATSAHFWEVLCMILTYLVFGGLGLLAFFWFTCFFQLTQREHRWVQKLSALGLVSVLFLAVPAAYVLHQKKVSPYLNPLEGMLTHKNASQLAYKAAQSKMQNGPALFNLAYQSSFLNSLDLARADTLDALKANPSSEKLKLNLILLDHLKGNSATAQNDLRALLRANPNFGLGHFNLGKMYFIRTNIEDAGRHRDLAKQNSAGNFFHWENWSQTSPHAPFVFGSVQKEDLNLDFRPQTLAPVMHRILKEHFPAFSAIIFGLVFVSILISSFVFYPYAPEEPVVEAYAQKDKLSFQEILEQSDDTYQSLYRKFSWVFPGYKNLKSAQMFRALATWFCIGIFAATFVFPNQSLPNPQLPIFASLWPFSWIAILGLGLAFVMNLFFRLAEQ